ncbi:hypothetical protein ACOZ38_24915 [Sphaerisporangium viridialbum]|uniref:hypothetical protein n=1 Tax=Sphaerisporangium viridialbum TaxID=46189 RepID=UPI003C7434EC
MHGYHQRRLADLPAGGRGVIVELQVGAAARACHVRGDRKGSEVPRSQPARGPAEVESPGAAGPWPLWDHRRWRDSGGICPIRSGRPK